MSIRLLLVEDDELDREAVERAIRASGDDIAVVSVGSLSLGVEQLREQRFDCVLSDLSLPDGEGLELLAHTSDAALVVLTGGADSRAHEALQRGAQDYLAKDQLDPRWLRRSIDYAIERKRLSTLAREAEHQDRLASLGHLAASIAHEINNPTAFVLANVDSLRRWWNEQEPGAPVTIEADLHVEFQQLLDDSAAGLDRVARIVSQLRSFGRRSDDDEPLLETTLAEAADWAVALTRTRITHVASLELQIPPSEGPFVGRAGRIAQVLTNLLLNATQAAEEGTRSPLVRLTIRDEGSSSIAMVEDSGAGLSPRLRERVFEPFYTTKPVGEGTGLGLSVSRDIVEAHGGSLTLEDSPLGGVRAVVRMPRRTQSRARSPTSTAVRATRPVQHWTLLVIDDEPALRRAYQRMLRPHVVYAMDGVSALQWLAVEGRAESVDAVLCDVMMPDVDGRQVYERVAVDHPSLAQRFVFCSGGAFRPELAGFLAASSVPVLLKPVSRDAIAATVQRLLD